MLGQMQRLEVERMLEIQSQYQLQFEIVQELYNRLLQQAEPTVRPFVLIRLENRLLQQVEVMELGLIAEHQDL